MKNKSVRDVDGPELFIGLVGAVGTNLNLVSDTLHDALMTCVGYNTETIKLSSLLHEISEWEHLGQTPMTEDKRIDEYMTAGNEFRKGISDGSALAALTIGRIREFRRKEKGSRDMPVLNYAYILKSLKHPDEVQKLRDVYGHNFLLVAAHSYRVRRIENLMNSIADSYNEFDREKYRAEAERLARRDETEEDTKFGKFGQNVRETFPMADVFVDASDAQLLKSSIKRFVELLFGYAFNTPTKDEYGMFHAQAAALRSASLSRQVGAAITTIDGDIITVGTNEVPKAGGGLYGAEDKPDNRDFTRGQDSNDKKKEQLLGDILQRLQNKKWLTEERLKRTSKDLVKEALSSDKSCLADAYLMDLIEFIREVHAEMAALIDASRRTVAVKGCTMYTTTFPCHDCAKHIVAAGITRVVYIKPYPKSLAQELFNDSIIVDMPRAVGHVSFEPFVGISPRQYMDLFNMLERKTRDGYVKVWNGLKELPRYAAIDKSYLPREQNQMIWLDKRIGEKGWNCEIPLATDKRSRISKEPVLPAQN